MTAAPPPDSAAYRDVSIPDAIGPTRAVVRLRVHIDAHGRPSEVTLSDGGGHPPARIAHWLEACRLISATLAYDARARTETTCRMEMWGDSILAAVARAVRA